MNSSPDAAISVGEVLEHLELPRAEPGPGYLERIFLRFNDRVPFETASKIVRNAEVSDGAEKPRWPGVFWREHIELGTGGTCFARVAAFEWLITQLGFHPRRVLGRVQSDFDHAALVVPLAAGEWICDVGFPLPALLPAADGEIETAGSTLVVSKTERGFRVQFRGGLPLGPSAVEIFTADVSPAEMTERWRETFRATSKFLTGVYARRHLAGRVLSFARGEVRIDDRHSRARLPLKAARLSAVADLFDVDRELVERAFAIVGDPEPELSTPRIDVFLETDLSPDAAFARIATPTAYARLMEGVGSVSLLDPAERSWRLRIEGEGAGAAVEERVSADLESRRLTVERGGSESSYAVETHDGRTFLVRGSLLRASVDELLRNDSVRGRAAGTLALDLLAWSRLPE